MYDVGKFFNKPQWDLRGADRTGVEMRKPEDRLNQQLERLCADDKRDRIYNTEISESDRTPGKYQLSIEGVPLQGEFDSENEARIFMAGFVAGASNQFQEMLQEKSKRTVPQ